MEAPNTSQEHHQHHLQANQKQQGFSDKRFPLIVFKNSINKQALDQMINEEIIYITDDNQRIIREDMKDDKQQISKTRKLLQVMLIFKGNSLFLISSDFGTTLIRSISGIEMPNLKSLQLGETQIESVQLLQWLNIAKLEELYLGLNRINSIKSIRKLNFPYMRYLALYDNNIEDFEGLDYISSKLYQEKREKTRILISPDLIQFMRQFSDDNVWPQQMYKFERGIYIAPKQQDYPSTYKHNHMLEKKFQQKYY